MCVSELLRFCSSEYNDKSYGVHIVYLVWPNCVRPKYIMWCAYCCNNRFSGWTKNVAGCNIPHFVNVSCLSAFVTEVFNNSNSLLSPANRHLCPAHQVSHIYQTAPFVLAWLVTKIINYLYSVFFLVLSTDHTELNAQVPAPFPSSQSQRHH